MFIDDTLLTFRDSLQIFISQIKKFLLIYVYQYYSDFYDFGTIRKRFEGAFEWYQNHQNPSNIKYFANLTVTAKKYFANFTML